MPKYKVRVEFEIETKTREEAVHLAEWLVNEGIEMKVFSEGPISIKYKVSGTEEIR